jgi:hypothetical protein
LLADPALPGGGDDGSATQDPVPIPPYAPSECEAKYKGLDSLITYLDDVPVYCSSIYTIDVLAKLLDSTITKYNDVKNDYDGKFGYYAGYINQ